MVQCDAASCKRLFNKEIVKLSFETTVLINQLFLIDIYVKIKAPQN